MNWRWGLHIILGLILTINFSCKKEEYSVIPIIYGHAGAALSEERAVFPPNSEQSILYAFNALAADGVEVDVQMTKDSVLVLFHDEFIEWDNTESHTCIAELSWSEIENFNSDEKYPIIRLSRLVAIMRGNSKKVILDLKHYNHCSEGFENVETFNWALNNELAELESDEKSYFTANCRNIELLNAVECGAMQKSFETENIPLAIDYAAIYALDLIVINRVGFTLEEAELLENAEIDYCIFGVKTKKEIKATANFRPKIIISDNIAGTKAYYN
ncbi:MAG: glycerophosphoryl diester phosphodiesterase [Crocinitomix sp.]|jgi:glycerophosphoryl diester phosphodiesterase